MSLEVINQDYENLVKNIKTYFDKSNDILHQARNSIKIINYQNKKLVVKSFKIPAILNKIKYTFFSNSKAQKSYQNSIKVGNHTPKAIGYIEFKKFGLIHSSYFVAESFKYNWTMHAPLHNNIFEDKNNLLKLFVSFVHKLHQKNILHLDLSPGNVLVQKRQDKYVFKIVDTNRMSFKRLSLNERLKNFEKLWAKDIDMKTIAKQYAKISLEDENYCIKKAIYYSQKNKYIVNIKKRLKGKKVVD